MTYFDVTSSKKINTNTQTLVSFERRCFEWRQTKLLVMQIASYCSIACVFIAWTVHTSQSSSNSIEKRFYSLFFWNFVKVCIQAFRVFVLILYFYGILGYVFHNITNIFRECKYKYGEHCKHMCAPERATYTKLTAGFNANIFLSC